MFKKLGFVGTLAAVVAVCAIVFAAAASACPQAAFAPSCNVGCYQAQAVLAPQVYVQPQAQVFVQRQVYAAPAFAPSYGSYGAYGAQAFAAPVGRVNVYAGRGAVGYGAGVAVAAPGVAVDVGKAKGRFRFRPRLQRAANVGASAALGVPARAVR